MWGTKILRKRSAHLTLPELRQAWLHAFHSACFVLVGIVIVHLLAYVANTFAPDGNTRFLQFDRKHVAQILRSSQKIEALAVGNSHAGALNLKALGYDTGYRFPRPDADLFEVQYYLEDLMPKLPRVEVVFIPISYFAFHEDNAASEEVTIRRSHMYATLSTWRFLEGDLVRFIDGKTRTVFPIMSIVRADNWEEVVYAMMGQQPEEEDFIEVAEDDCTSLDDDTMAASIANRVEKHTRITAEVGVKNPDVTSDTYKTVIEIHRYLQDRGVRAVFFTPPYFKGYTEHYQATDPETIALMRQAMVALQREYGIEYYDFSTDEDFVFDKTLFRDSDHLNGCGAKLFSEKFRQILMNGW